MSARLWRIKHDAALLGWEVCLLQGARLRCTHSRGAQIVWPMPRQDPQEAALLAMLHNVPPRSAEAEAEFRRLEEHRRAVKAFYEAQRAQGR